MQDLYLSLFILTLWIFSMCSTSYMDYRRNKSINEKEYLRNEQFREIIYDLRKKAKKKGAKRKKRGSIKDWLIEQSDEEIDYKVENETACNDEESVCCTDDQEKEKND